MRRCVEHQKVSNMTWTKIVPTGGYLDANAFRFDNDGDSLEGVLRESVDITSREGDTFKKYVVQAGDVYHSFLGCYQLDITLPKVEIGKTVRVTYHGKEKLRGGKSVRKFTVEVKAE